ncbi:hypothetical protein VFPFJ_04616 [Purpureocillium lilacinum]|uniref:Uncharacterized protein n=1 Tax=Purpureocillium lilacinum TaxID=33203 RepID=A0A179HJ26_PURLI|nr:hypothetical protein VFPFJ_04616 [Purpureocillium lilacinum]OAQ90456.1 hypothetical protein VFPFJ_04616 [Purpureocillium lilacinum]
MSFITETRHPPKGVRVRGRETATVPSHSAMRQYEATVLPYNVITYYVECSTATTRSVGDGCRTGAFDTICPPSDGPGSYN